jgi:tetratricopeptide (TPR) repeat protein
MNDNYREQIKKDLLSRDTEYLLNIWQNGNFDEWEKDVFTIVEEILFDRLGKKIPPASIERQISLKIDIVKEHLKRNKLDKALSECKTALKLNPNSAIVHNCLGELYDEMGRLEEAILHYQKAIHINPKYEDAWENMLSVESELEDWFKESKVKKKLDKALDYANSGAFKKALEECKKAKPLLPSLAMAYNYLGLIMQTADQIELAIDSYLKAIQVNPRFFAARENLASARIRGEEEQYISFSNVSPIDELPLTSNYKNADIPENAEPIPQWLYMDKSAFFLVGWVGHRTRQGRSGYDPLDRDFEFAHSMGYVIRGLFTGKYRTRNPIYLFLMIFTGLLLCSPLYLLTYLNQFEIIYFFILITDLITSASYWLTGIALLMNVVLSMFPIMGITRGTYEKL